MSLAVLLLVSASGCSWFGPDETEKAASPCTGITNQFAAASVSASACEADARGQWLEGRCYCHGLD